MKRRMKLNIGKIVKENEECKCVNSDDEKGRKIY